MTSGKLVKIRISISLLVKRNLHWNISTTRNFLRQLNITLQMFMKKLDPEGLRDLLKVKELVSG